MGVAEPMPEEVREITAPARAVRTVGSDRPIRVEPNLDFIRLLGRQSGAALKKCFQCGTCSASCPISPETDPFPRKEMAWAAWGLRDRLLNDPDIWLCHQCNDCSKRCPRGVRPGDVLAAVRQLSVEHFAVPGFLGRWVNRPRFIPVLLLLPTLLLGLALLARDPLQNFLGLFPDTGERIVFSYSSHFPHWLLDGFFLLFGLLIVLAVVTSVVKFWRALAGFDREDGGNRPAKNPRAAIGPVLRNIVTHDNFALCTSGNTRLFSHLCVFFGFLALSVVTLWVITGRYNPLLHDFIYPFGFWSPWKILANLGGIAVLVGCLSMIWDRLSNRENAGNSSYFDWSFLGALSIVVLTGFFTEVLHYLRMVPHRHVIYFVHLVFVFALLMYLPYSKFAHLIYRTVALVYAASTGRVVAARGSREVGRLKEVRKEPPAALPAASGVLRETGAQSP